MQVQSVYSTFLFVYSLKGHHLSTSVRCLISLELKWEHSKGTRDEVFLGKKPKERNLCFILYQLKFYALFW